MPMTKRIHRTHRLGMRPALALALVLLSAIATNAASNELAHQAGEITASTPEGVRARGLRAVAGLGDWYLSNGLICAAVQGTEHHGQLIPGGGMLVDLAHCGRGDDQFISVEPLYNLDRTERLRIDTIESYADAQVAEIVTRASEPGLTLTTRYRLESTRPSELVILTTIERHEEGEPLFAVADILLHAESSLRNFVINNEGTYSGFRHTHREQSAYLEIASAVRRATGVVLVGSQQAGPPISYLYLPTHHRLRAADGSADEVGTYSVGFSSITATNLGTRPSWFPSKTPGLLQAVQIPLMDIGVGETFEFERIIAPSPRADVASLTDRIFGSSPHHPAGTVTAQTSTPFTRIHVFDTSETADLEHARHVTMASPAPSGAVSFKLPYGDYRLKIVSPNRPAVMRDVSLSSAEPDINLGTLDLPAVASIALPDNATMRLVFRGLGETPNPRFGDDLTGLSLGGKPKPNSMLATHIDLVSGIDPGQTIPIAAGRYRVYATRGPEFSLTQTDIHVGPGALIELPIEEPKRLFETPGWITADFHVHAAPSFDSTLPIGRRLKSFVAEGGEVLVATDHDIIADYDSPFAAAGLTNELVVMTGLEVTTMAPTPRNPHTTGHINVYPVPYRPELNRGGAHQDEGQRLRDIIDWARSLPDRALVQLNHPRDLQRDADHGAFLDHLSIKGTPFVPGEPLEAESNRSLLEAGPNSGTRDIDFDIIEIMNGPGVDAYRKVQQDWFSLLSQGYLVSAMANSDSHRLKSVVSVPRNYVRVANDEVATFEPAAFLDAAKKGHACGTTGPLLDVTLGTSSSPESPSAGPGDRFVGGNAQLSINVRAAPWVNVSTLRVYRNGSLDAETKVDGTSLTQIDMVFEADAYITVEVEGEASAAYADILPNFTPIAFCNPIYVDADANGEWTAPGLPVR
ncbi:MAG: hypothetical protein ACI8W3_000512 [Myxococcota bacterium]|jgi:hypothetical protein